MGKHWRGRGGPGGTTPGQLNSLARACDQASATISQLGDERSQALAASLASLRRAAASLVEAADAATSSKSTLLKMPRELQVRILSEVDAYGLTSIARCARVFHAPSAVTGKSLTTEAVLTALAKLPDELTKLLSSSGSSVTWKLQRLTSLQREAERWQRNIDFQTRSDEPVLVPILTEAASQISISLEAMALRALEFTPTEHHPRTVAQYPIASHAQVLLGAIKVLRGVWLVDIPWLPKPEPGTLVVRLVIAAIEGTQQPDDVQTFAVELALRMAPELVRSLRVETPLQEQTYVNEWDFNQPHLREPAGEHPQALQEEAKFQKAADLLRATWKHCHAAGDRRPEMLAIGGHAAWLLSQVHRVQEAEEVLRALIPGLASVHGVRSKDALVCQSLLVELLVFSERWEEAMALLIELLDGPPVVADGRDDFYGIERELGRSAYRTQRHFEDAQNDDMRERLLRACIAYNGDGYLTPEDFQPLLTSLLIKRGRLDGVEMLRNALQEKDSAAKEAIEDISIDNLESSSLVLDHRKFSLSSAIVLHMQLINRLDEKGRTDEAAQERERLILRYVEDVGNIHDRLLSSMVDSSGAIKRVRNLTHIPYGAYDHRGEYSPRFYRGLREMLTNGVSDLEERVESVLSQRASEAKAQHGTESTQAWCATARLMTHLEETKQVAAALPLAHELMAWTERRLGSDHPVALEMALHAGRLSDSLGAVDDATCLQQKVYDTLLSQTPDGDDEARRVHLWGDGGGRVPLHDCGKKLADTQKRHGRHSESAETLRRMFTDLGAPPETNGQHDLEMLKFEFACALVHCRFRRWQVIEQA